jgi:hypothetical protein
MRMLLSMSLASLNIASVWLLNSMEAIRLKLHTGAVRSGLSRIAMCQRAAPTRTPLRLAAHRQPSLCEHCRMNEATHLPGLCTYCYWNLPASRLVEYVRDQSYAPRRRVR